MVGETLSLRLTGPVEVDVAGRPLAVDTRKAIAILALLAVDGPVARDSLAGMLWPESDQPRARSALRRTLSVLRRGLDGRWVEADRDVLRLSGSWWADIRLLRETLATTATHDHPAARPCEDCTARLETAVAHLRGEFMEGFGLRGSAPFDAWQTQTGEALRRDHGTALSRLVVGLTTADRVDDALGPARAHVALDPLHEPAQRRLMLLLAWSGRRSEATRAYRGLVAELDRELGVRPLPETAHLHDAIVHDHLPPRPGSRAAASVRASPSDAPGRPPDRPEAPIDGRLPLVGRDDLLDELQAAVTPAEDHRGALLAIRGEAGSGKTRLVAELLDRLALPPGRVATVRCAPGDSGVAYAPIVAALRQATGGGRETGGDGWRSSVPAHWREEAARLVPELAAEPGRDGGRPEPLSSPGAQARFVEGVWTVLAAALGDGGTGVLVIDDLHRADEASIALLAWGCARIDRRGLAVITCWRDEELDAGHPWRATVADAVGAGRARDVVPTRLTRRDLAELVGRVAPEADPGLAERLMDETEGLPLAVAAYLPELVSGVEPDRTRLPADLQGLYATRIAALDDLPRQVLTAAAVIGRSVDVDLLTAISGRAEEEVVSALEVLSASGMLVDTGGTHDFTHEKLRTAVYQASSPARRRLLHGRTADALRAGADAAPALVAHHEHLGGRDRAAALAHAQAGDRARRLFANRQALGHLREALALGHPDPAMLHATIGELEMLEGDYAAALSSLDTAAALVDDPETVATIECRAAAVQRRRGELAPARLRLVAALELLGPDGPLEARARVHAELALVHAQAGDLEAADRAARTTLGLAEQAVDREGVAQARNLLGMLARRSGELGDAQRHLELSADLASRLPSPDARVAALNNLALVLKDAGKPEQAIRHATEAVRLCARIGDRHHEAALHSNLADLLHATGRDGEAEDHLTRSAELFSTVGGAPRQAPEIWRLVDW